MNGGEPDTSAANGHSRIAGALAVTALLAGMLAACGQGFPVDPDGTLESIRSSGELRAGASHNPPQVVHPSESSGGPTGTEVELVEAYARHLGARVEWTIASETALMEKLEEGELDLAVAGLRTDSVWADTAGLTRAYAQESAPDGTTLNRVIATPLGENALMVDLERWFDSYEGRADGRG